MYKACKCRIQFLSVDVNDGRRSDCKYNRIFIKSIKQGSFFIRLKIRVIKYYLTMLTFKLYLFERNACWYFLTSDNNYCSLTKVWPWKLYGILSLNRFIIIIILFILRKDDANCSIISNYRSYNNNDVIKKLNTIC